MNRKKTTFNIISRSGRSVNRGFTLVEMIVVIAIIAIVAAAGIATAIGYINHSKFEKNSQHALTVYQTTQTALAKKTSNGTITEWLMGFPGIDDLENDPDLDISSDSGTDYSTHKLVSLTYNPTSDNNSGENREEDDYLYELLSPYFYDRSIFSGTMAVELDICRTKNNDISDYSVTVVSAFYSAENNSSSGGWDSKCVHGSGDGLPDRSDEYRQKTSYVGYYIGSSDGTLPGNVSSVAIPWDEVYELDGHIVGPTDDGSQAVNYLFNVCNAETLDVSWAIFDADKADDSPATYTYSAIEDHEEDLYIILTEMGKDIDSGYSVKLHVVPDGISYGSEVYTTYEVVNGTPIVRKSWNGFIHGVEVTKMDGSTETMSFPITKTLVTGDDRTGCPVETDKGYYEYSLTLDAMMDRSSSGGYGINRLFGDNTPRNIYATLSSASTWHRYDKENNWVQVSPSNTYAARAINDPVYLTDAGTGMNGGHLSYFYNVKEYCAEYDLPDSAHDEYIITGTAHVNTYFGDKIYEEIPGSFNEVTRVGGTSWSGSDKEAVLTNCRHLYNIRMMENDTVCYRIVSNLNWYVHNEDSYVSRVKVFTSSESFHSPVPDDVSYQTSPLRIVSFPAIDELKSNATLTSISDSDKKVYSINNFQMRSESFNNVTQEFGLICKNKGRINNLYINSLSLILTSVPDGSASDYTGNGSELCPSGSVSVEKDSSGNVSKNYIVGGFVGLNEGTIGSSSETDESINTVRVTNSVVLGGNYWKWRQQYRDVGGVIGKEMGSTYGLIKVGGSFAVLGYKNVGGIIGYCGSDISARLVVDGFEKNNGKSEFDLPVMGITGKQISCAVISDAKAGGAVGSFDGKTFTRNVAHYNYSISNTATGEISFDKLDEKDYHIYVTLPSDSLILHSGGSDDNDNASAGGVIGCLNNATGNYLSIYTDIAGYIVSSGSVNSYCGGVIGKERSTQIKDIYLDCGNAYGSVIGSTSDSTGAVASGGAYGYIDSSATARTIAINVYNDGTIRSRGSGSGLGSGGAIGGAANNLKVPLIIKAFNDSESEIIGTGSDKTNCNGTGGAIGGLGDPTNNKTSLPSATRIYVNNKGAINGQHHVGGAIGNVTLNYGNIYVVNAGSIDGSYYVGGAIGRAIGDQYGTIQSTLSGADISGRHFVGGAAGRLLNFQDDAVVRTVVKSKSEIYGSGYLVGGVCGDILVAKNNPDGRIELKGDSTNPELVIKGGDDSLDSVGVGGIVGVVRLQDASTVDIIMPAQSDLNRLAMKIDGQNDIGGAIGRLTCNSSTEIEPESTVSCSTTTNCVIDLTVVLNPQTKILGTGNNVGGAIGYIDYKDKTKFSGTIKVSSVYGSNTDGSLIQGKTNVGGAVGNFSKALPLDSGSSMINVDFSRSPWTIEGTVNSGEANVGGAVGHFIAVKDSVSGNVYFPITVKLGTSTVTSGGSNVGGAVGFNENSLVKSDLEVRQEVNGLICGNENVGGVIGNNKLDWSYGALHDLEARINGTVSGNGKNVGGAIGYNLSSLNNVVTYINGIVTGESDNVGGAIGNCASKHRDYKLNILSSYIHGSGRVIGKDNVGGTIGFNESNINEIDVSISGNSKVIGEDCVGGALGYASSVSGQTGKNILALANDKCYGRILKVDVVISADYALSGTTKLGGAIGRIGDKTNGSVYNSACVVNVQTTLNSAYLFDPGVTGTARNSNACIGGIVGIFIDGRLGVDGGGVKGAVVLKGSGGVVNTSKYVDTDYYPARTYGKAVFIGASGCSIGGIVGQIGIEQMQQNVCLANISVDKGPDLVVVSLNGGDRIGGWIGSGYAAHGGIGNNDSAEYNSTPVKYDVKNVKAVISIGGSEIGGFCGRTDAHNGGTTNQVFTFAKINVDLSDANVIGTSKVGGAFGEANLMNFNNGGINVKLSNYTNIGDIAGNALPGDNNEYTPICYYAGGAIGCVEGVRKNNYNNFHIPVTVTIDSTSRVCGLGDVPDGSDVSKIGVGGAFGTCDALFNSGVDRQLVRVTSEHGSVAAVISKNANVGGVVGVLVDNNFKNASANVTVQLDSGAEGLYIGGVAGRVKAGTVDKCHFGPDAEITKDGYFDDEIARNGYFDNSSLFGEGAVYDAASYRVISNGASSFAGGFMGGSDGSVTISNCYTTASVISDNSDSTGGFAGKASTGTISKSYVGGHTYSKHYISGSGDITGAGNVGGFVGKTTGNVTFDSCYSTASVLGTGSYVGGFVGYRHNNSIIKNSYCTGSVISSDEETTGAFAGYSAKTNYTSSSAMTGVNALPLAGNVPGTETITNLSYKNADSIRGSNSYTGHPFDSSLGSSYALRGVINNEHWGDWPVVTGAISITNLTIDLTPDSVEYCKSGYQLEDFLTIMHDDYELQYGLDYTLAYTNATKAGDTAKVIISGINNYDGAVSLPFTITRASILTAEVTISYPEGITGGFEYTGAENKPESTVKLGEDILVKGRDYHLEYSPNNINIGTVTVKVVGDGNYKDEIANAGTFEIIGRNLAAAEVTLLNATEEELVYDGNPKEPGVIVRLNGKTLTRDTDYRVEFVCDEFKDDEDPEKKYNHTDVGTIIVLILPVEGNDQYSGQNDETTFDITQATNVVTQEPSISGWIWSYPPQPLTNELKTTFGVPRYSVYTDSTCNEASKVVDYFAAADLSDTGSTAYQAMNNLDAGDYYLLADVEVSKNYTSVSKTVPFSIAKANISDQAATVAITLEYNKIPYTGDSLTPAVTSFTFNGRTLVEGDDFTVAYDTDTVNPGTKTVTITGKNNCYGSVTAEYVIQPVWEVTFDPGICSITDDFENPAKVTDRETVTAPTDEQLIHDDYRFDGWYTNSLFAGKPYKFNTPVTGDMTLYAKWTRLWKFTFILYDGVEEVQTVPDGGKLTKPEDPTREGYDFAGWFLDDNNEWTNFDATITKEYPPVYAHWTPQVHTVTFDSNGGTDVQAQTLTYGEDALEEPDDPTYNDGTNEYRFDGWFTDEECTDEFTAFGSYVAEDMTLYAKWTKLWEVTLVLYDGADDVVVPTGDQEDLIIPSGLSRTYYDLAGWCTDPGRENEWVNEPVDGNLTLCKVDT